MKRIAWVVCAALLLLAPTASAEIKPILAVGYEIDSSLSRSCNGSRCAEARVERDYGKWGFTLGARYQWERFFLGATFDTDYGIGATARTGVVLFRHVSLGIGAGIREYSSLASDDNMTSATTTATYLAADLRIGPVFARYSELTADASHRFINDGSRVRIKDERSAWMIGVALPF